MYKTYKGHFDSARRFVYALIPKPGEGHIHYIIGQLYDAASMYYIDNAYDTGSGCYMVDYEVDREGVYTVKNNGDYNE